MDNRSIYSLYSLKDVTIEELKQTKKTSDDISIKLKISLNKEENKEIIINRNSNPEKIAYNFCHKNNLDYKSLQILTKKLKSIKNSYLSKYKNSINNMKNNNKNIKSTNRCKLKNNIFTEEIKDINNKVKNQHNLTDFINEGISIENSKKKIYT
jgi:hypothetical protein